ncbi:MAG: DUF4279 domain-containing protein [Firmicutes bacterium]|nr:DUF4279 domain-containing protein [Bacillota bacterium]
MIAKMQAHATLIGNHIDTDAVTEELQMIPNWIKKRDDEKFTGSAFGHDEWGVSTAWTDLDDETFFFENIVHNLLELLPQDAHLLKTLAQKHHAEWHILFDIDVYEGFPSIIFENDFIVFAGMMGATIGFDVYNYQE